ncbi:hypothetical protein [Gilvimarinus agarilyticus]|uniref:hypothetical protein n=1 Tax=Gilvimarinus agarilyticus TaxID=679259 RepID=UPI0005A1BB9A|nr:hypothetical protein [Gilvimarinus agarilyticus]
MALKFPLITTLFLGAALVAVAQDSNRNAADDRAMEEIVVTAPNWRKETAPTLPEDPRWQIDDETRVKMQSRMQFGYDPVLDEIRNSDNRIKLHSDVNEPEPSTIFRFSF